MRHAPPFGRAAAAEPKPNVSAPSPAELADSIAAFIDANSGDRQTMAVLSDLKAVESQLRRISHNKDTSMPSPGQQAALKVQGG